MISLRVKELLRMKVLLSAFHCQPNSGSEFARGWAWATELAKMGHEVWVITRDLCKPQVEQELQTNPISKLHFIYCGMPTWYIWANKVIKAIRIPLAQKLMWQLLSTTWWQWDAYRMAESLHQEVAFELVHHVTNSTVRRPSFMGLLGIPFVLGPLAGGVKTPWSLRKSYPFRGKFLDFCRDLNNGLVKFHPLMHLTFAKATKIYCDSKQTQALIPKFYRSKSEVLFSMPTYDIPEISQVIERESTEKEIFRVLFVGRFLYWKGIHLGLKAFAQLHHKIPSSRFTLIGSGHEQAMLQRLSKKLGIDEAVDWIPWMERKKLSSAYLQHDVFLFPSLHDMGGNVVIEAMCHGLPLVCLDLGGPGVMVNETCGRVIGTDKLREEAVIQALSDALVELAENSGLRQQLSEGALAQPSQFEFMDVVEHIYKDFEDTLACERGSSKPLFGVTFGNTESS